MPTTTPLRSLLRRSALPAVSIAVLTLAGCGTGSGDSSSGSAGDPGSQATTVAVRDADGGQVLTDSNGQTLYVSDQEKQQVLCKSNECIGIWSPLMVSPGQTPRRPPS